VNHRQEGERFFRVFSVHRTSDFRCVRWRVTEHAEDALDNICESVLLRSLALPSNALIAKSGKSPPKVTCIVRAIVRFLLQGLE